MARHVPNTGLRGANQSCETKWATLLVCDAMESLRSGDYDGARDGLREALALLPEVGHAEQGLAELLVSARRTTFVEGCN